MLDPDNHFRAVPTSTADLDLLLSEMKTKLADRLITTCSLSIGLRTLPSWRLDRLSKWRLTRHQTLWRQSSNGCNVG